MHSISTIERGDDSLIIWPQKRMGGKGGKRRKGAGHLTFLAHHQRPLGRRGGGGERRNGGRGGGRCLFLLFTATITQLKGVGRGGKRSRKKQETAVPSSFLLGWEAKKGGGSGEKGRKRFAPLPFFFSSRKRRSQGGGREKPFARRLPYFPRAQLPKESEKGMASHFFPWGGEEKKKGKLPKRKKEVGDTPPAISLSSLLLIVGGKLWRDRPDIFLLLSQKKERRERGG